MLVKTIVLNFYSTFNSQGPITRNAVSFGNWTGLVLVFFICSQIKLSQMVQNVQETSSLVAKGSLALMMRENYVQRRDEKVKFREK